jgi:hypothetical protein
MNMSVSTTKPVKPSPDAHLGVKIKYVYAYAAYMSQQANVAMNTARDSWDQWINQKLGETKITKGETP